MQVNSSREGAVSAGGDSSSRTTLAILKEARQVISDPEKWHQGYYALTADKREVFGVHPEAVCWCSIGAIHKVQRGTTQTAHVMANYFAADAMCALTDFNDKHSHSEVMQLWDRTIAKLEAKQVSA